MSNQFTSIQNKGLLWELMSNESPEFKKGISQSFKETQKKFEDCISKTFETHKQNRDLLQMNKLFISTLNNEFINTNPVLSKDIQKSRTQKLNNDFESKKQEMESFLQTKKPDEIDFSLTSDSPISNVDDILNKKVAERNYDIASAVSENKNNMKEAEKWIGIDSNTEEKNEIISSVPDFEADNLFNKLKQDPYSNESFLPHQGEDFMNNSTTNELLMKIIENQNINKVLY